MVSRRCFLGSIGSISAVALAGCSQVDKVKEVAGVGPERPEGPAAVVEHYFTAIQNEDVEAANQVFFPESSEYPLQEGDISYDAEINEITQVEELSIREVAEFVAEGESDQESTEEQINQNVAEIEQANEERINKYGVDDATYVYISYLLDGEETEEVEAVIQDEGAWYIPSLVILGL